MLRSIGIPARLAVGFARGELIDGAYVVHRRDAHAWPEVYFPGIGWVEFEPTANQSPLARPSGVQEVAGGAPVTPGRGGVDDSAEQFPEQVELAPPPAPLPFRLTPAGRALFTGGPILLILAVLAAAYRLRIWSRLPSYIAHNIEASGGFVPHWLTQWELWFQAQPVERLFAVVGWTLRILGQPQSPAATPAAQTAALSRLIPSATRNLDVLRTELETGLFTDRPAELGRARKASLLVLLHGLGALWQKTLTALNGRTVYSDPDLFHRPRG